MVKRVLLKKERVVLVDGRERTISDFEKHYVDPSKDFHTRHGIIRKEDLQKKAGSLIVQDKNEYIILDSDFIDDYRHIKRSAQIISLKDIGAIIVNTGITRSSKVLEAGVGSGAVTCYLAMIAKKIVSYDIDDRSLETARENVKAFGLKNVEIKQGDIYDSKQIKEKGFDVFTLDVPEPWKAIATAKKALNIGGFLSVYLPNISQVQEFVKHLPEDEFLIENTIEVIEREWAVDAKRTRPATKDFGHTGFLTFARKIR
jgi:tRNA (adenine57-N1/adenine58-N1)-methyltransferase catalytic subunit